LMMDGDDVWLMRNGFGVGAGRPMPRYKQSIARS